MTAVQRAGTAVSADEQLARVREATDAGVMGPRLRAALAAHGGTACHVLDAKYEPGKACTVLYRVGDRLVRGDVLVDPAADAGGCPAGPGPGTAPSVPPGVRLSPFPHDPDLPGLADTADPQTLGPALQRGLPGLGPVLRCRAELVRYRPAKRATFAVEVRSRSARRGARLVVKSYHQARKAAAVAAEGVLLGATDDPGTPLRFAPVLAHLPELSLVVQGHVQGVRLDEVVRRPGPPAAQALQRAAVALAALHARPLVSDRTRSIEAELARFAARAARVAQVDPATGRHLVDLAARLAGTAADVPPGPVGLVHGDCKPSQFLLRGEREVVLLDLDSCGRADPAGDVGTFLATLRQQSARQVLAGRTTSSAVRTQRALAEVFLRAYTDAAGSAPDAQLRRRIGWYEAVALERKALRCFARAPRSPLVRALVDAGHACLDGMGGTR